MLYVVLAIVILSAGFGLRSMLASFSSQLLKRPGTRAAYPIEVQLKGLSEETVYRSAVTRISPRGNETPMNHRFVGNGDSWYVNNEYFRTVRVYLTSEASDKLSGILIDVGGRQRITQYPGVSPHWKRVDQSKAHLPGDLQPHVEANPAVFEYVPKSNEFAWTVLPPFSKVLNYIGDLRLAFWSLLWASLVVIPTAFAVSARNGWARISGSTIAWFMTAVSFVVATATIVRFTSPNGAFEAHVEPMAVVARALSLALLLVIAIRAGTSQTGLGKGSETGPAHRSQFVPVAAITLGGLILRSLDLDSILRVDLFNLSSAFSLYDTGGFVYMRNVDITKGVAALMQLLGRSVEVAKIPFVAAGTIAIPLVYLLGRFVTPTVGLVAAALVAIDPYQIGVSGFIREYPVTLLVAIVIALAQFGVYRRFSASRVLFLPILVAVSGVFSAAVLFYAEVANNGTVVAALQSSMLVTVALVLHFIGRHFPSLFRPVTAAVLLLMIVGFSVVHNYGPFSQGFHLRPELFRAHFDPMSSRTMHTFSLAAVSKFFVVALCIYPFMSKKRSPYLDAILLSFWGTLLLFTLKLDAGDAGRYLHHVSAFQAVLFAGGLVWLFQMLKTSIPRRPARWTATVLLFLVIVNPINSIQSALNLVPNARDIRTPTDLSSGNSYEELVEFMRMHGVDSTSPLIEAARTPDSASILLNRRFTRRKTNRGRNWKDIGEGIYPIRWNVLEDSVEAENSNTLKDYADHSIEAFQNHDSGYLITDRYRMFPPSDFQMEDVVFRYLGSTPHPYNPEVGFVLYRWSVRGPRLPDFSLFFSAEKRPLKALPSSDIDHESD